MTAPAAEGNSMAGAILLEAAAGLQEALASGGPWGVSVLPAVSWVLDGLGAVLDGSASQSDCPAQAREPLTTAGKSITAATGYAGVAWGNCGQPGPGPATPPGAEAAAWRAATAAQALYREPPAAALRPAAEALGTLADCLDSTKAALPARSLVHAHLAKAAGSLRTACRPGRAGCPHLPRAAGPAAGAGAAQKRGR